MCAGFWKCADCGLAKDEGEEREQGPCEESITTRLPWTDLARKRRAERACWKRADEEEQGKRRCTRQEPEGGSASASSAVFPSTVGGYPPRCKETANASKRLRLTGKQNPTGYYAKRPRGAEETGIAATVTHLRGQKRKHEAPDTLQPRDAGGHLMYVQDGIHWCWRCGAYSRKRLHDLRGTCFGEPGPGQAYRLKRLKNSRHPVSNAPLAGLAILVVFDFPVLFLFAVFVMLPVLFTYAIWYLPLPRCGVIPCGARQPQALLHPCPGDVGDVSCLSGCSFYSCVLVHYVCMRCGGIPRGAACSSSTQGAAEVGEPHGSFVPFLGHG